MKYLTELLERLNTFHTTNLSIPMTVGRKVKHYKPEVEQAKEDYTAYIVEAEQLLTNVNGEIEEQEQLLETQTEALEISLKVDGISLKGARDKVEATFYPQIELINQNYEAEVELINNTSLARQVEQERELLQEELDKIKSQIPENVHVSKTWDWSYFLKLGIFELVFLVALAMLERNFNIVVYELLGINMAKAELYATGMAIFFGIWMAAAGYIIKIGWKNPLGKSKGMVIGGILMTAPILFMMFWLVQERETFNTIAEMQAASDSTGFIVLAAILYLLSMLPSLWLADPIPYTTKLQIRKLLNLADDKAAELKAKSDACVRLETQRQQDLTDAKKARNEKLAAKKSEYGTQKAEVNNKFDFETDGKFTHETVTMLREQIQHTIPNKINELEMKRNKLQSEISNFKYIVQSLFEEFVTELDSRYKKHHADGVLSSIKSGIRMSLSSIVLLCLTIFLTACGGSTPADADSTNVTILLDKTEAVSYDGQVSPEKVFSMLNVDPKGRMAMTTGMGSLTISNINNVNMNSFSTRALYYDMVNDPRIGIAPKIKTFVSDVRGDIDMYSKGTGGENTSRIFAAICYWGEKISKSDDTEKILIVFSDLIENHGRNDFNFFKHRDDLGTPRDSTVLSDLETATGKTLPNLSGVTVILVCDQKTVNDPELADKASTSYMRWLEAAGAKAKRQANL